jgi:hypothetical protein
MNRHHLVAAKAAAPGLKVKTGVKAGGIGNHNETLGRSR